MASLEAMRVTKRIEIHASETGVDAVAGKVRNLAGAQDAVATATEKTVRSSLSAEGAVNRLARTYSNAFRVQQDFEKAQRTLDRAYSQGLGGTLAYEVAVDGLAAAQRRAAIANDNFGTSAGAAGHHVRNLLFQLSDVGTMLASGSSPMQVLATQGGQIAQVLGDTGVSGAVKGVASSVASVLTPARLLLGGFVGIGAAALLIASNWKDGQREIQTSLEGLGRGTDATAGQLNRIAESVAGTARISASASRELVSTYAATGRIGTDVFKGLIKATRDYAVTTGQDIPTASKELAQAFADPAKGAETLDAKLGFLDDRTAEYIKRLVAQNDSTKAQTVLLEALTGSLGNADNRLSAFGRGWETLKRVGSDALDSIGRALTQATALEDKLAQSIKARREIQEGPSGKSPRGQAATAFLDEQISLQQEAVRRQAQARLLESAEFRAVGLSRSAGAAVRSLNPDIAEVRALQDNVALLEKAVENEAAKSRMSREELDRLTTSRDKAREAVSSYKTALELEAESNRIALDAAKARSPAELGDIARRQKLLELAGKAGDRYTEEQKAILASAAAAAAAAPAQQALTDAQRERLRAANDAIGTAQLDIDIIGKSAGKVAELRANWQAETTLRAEAERNHLAFDTAEFERLKKINAEMGRKVQLAAEARVKSDIAFDRATLGLSDTDVQIAQKLRAIYGDDIKKALESDEAAGMRFNSTMKEGLDAGRNSVAALVRDLTSGIKPLEAMTTAARGLGNSLQQIGSKSLFDSIANGLKGGSFSFDPISLGFGVVGTVLSAGAGPINPSKSPSAKERARERLQHSREFVARLSA